MTIQHKLSELAKDLGVQNKALIDLFTQWTGEVKKHTAQLTEQELNRVFEHYTKEAEVATLDEYLDCLLYTSYFPTQRRRCKNKPHPPCLEGGKRV